MRRPQYAILEGHEVVPVENIGAWARWYEFHDRERLVGQDFVDGYEVNTAFTGVDVGFRSDGEAPHYFEIAVFAPEREWVVRVETADTWDDAELKHRVTVRWVREMFGGQDV